VRLGLFGGTFDPPHVGHLLAASDAHDLLGLDRLVFIPAAQQPLKVGRTMASPEDRLAMLTAMVEGDPRFEVDGIEIRRSGLSFTVETLEAYAERLPGADCYFCVGADAVRSLDAWREPARVVALAHLAVLTRADGALSVAEAEVRRLVRKVGGSDALDPVIVSTRRIDVSSTEVRERVRAGKPIRGFVTDAVARYVERGGLYR
jgi:nicotinate-nucleotide adenylyltransferase